MDRQEIEKLLKDISAHFPDNHGNHFAKSINMLINEMPVSETRKEFLLIIEHLIEIINESRDSSKTE